MGKAVGGVRKRATEMRVRSPRDRLLSSDAGRLSALSSGGIGGAGRLNMPVEQGRRLAARGYAEQVNQGLGGSAMFRITPRGSRTLARYRRIRGR